MRSPSFTRSEGQGNQNKKSKQKTKSKNEKKRGEQPLNPWTTKVALRPSGVSLVITNYKPSPPPLFGRVRPSPSFPFGSRLALPLPFWLWGLAFPFWAGPGLPHPFHLGRGLGSLFMRLLVSMDMYFDTCMLDFRSEPPPQESTYFATFLG